MSVAARRKQKPNRKSAIKNRKSFMAERVGFEPTERFPVHSISSAANSTTLAPLRRLPISDCQLSIVSYGQLKQCVQGQSAIINGQSAMSWRRGWDSNP